MSQMLAPYNNSMRLGQGFNSYTQQVCLDRAVLAFKGKGSVTKEEVEDDTIQSSTNAEGGGNSDLRVWDYDEQPQGNDSQGTQEKKKPHVLPWVKPQIVTYSSRFVDKISDVTDAMNISGSLSIKTATIGGKANGSYIDSDKFKSSDINFHLQVKVTNQIHSPPEYCVFNKISNVDKEEFPEVYGDCFISGWEEGGELNAIISMKVHDKSKVFDIKAKLEGELSTPSISGGVTAELGITKSELSRSTETTISVNWSGGGSIKKATDDWSITTLKKAAAAFPDLVAVTPQRTYAILTKYTSLADFHFKKHKEFSLLDYENAGIYTNSLLDHYMDYKAMWKQISHATYELKAGRATIEIARPSQETESLATIRPLPVEQVDAKKSKRKMIADAAGSQNAPEGKGDGQSLIAQAGNVLSEKDPNAIKFSIFSPSFAGLVHARKVCRFEMAKIVNEVDLVASHPELALDTARDSYFLNPLVFEQLIPIVRSLSPESAKLGVKNPDAALLLGYLPPAEEQAPLTPVHKFDKSLETYHPALQNSIQKCAWKAQDYLLQGIAGSYAKDDVHEAAKLTNDLETLDATDRPVKLLVWSSGETIKGIRFEYSNRSSRFHGGCQGNPSHIWELAADASEIIVEVLIRERANKDNQKVISSVAFVTSRCRVFDTAIKQEEKDKPTPSTTEQASTEPAVEEAGSSPASYKLFTYLRPEGAQWSLRGFVSFSYLNTITSLGVVWSKDPFVPIPTQQISPPICKSFLTMGTKLQENVRRFKEVESYSHYAETFLLGESVAAAVESWDADRTAEDAGNPFNALDRIGESWRIKTITFASAGGRLTGLRVTYNNGQVLRYGILDHEVWTCEVESDLLVAKLTAGRAAKGGPGYVDTVEFICADKSSKKGEQALWPLDVSTLRYLGEGKTRASVDVSTVVEKAPTFGENSKWTVRGFYGQENGKVITRLGVIWGRR